ncbi:MAG: alpha-glucan family phosphorylase, partial [Peptococcaceae bacterium]|nr:alpha-glucan family phosphorylase [Peptococcaceae bacterium]
MEYGLSEHLPIYAGGLGVLAGDYIKAARDLGLPVVALGILWRQDYTHQFIGQDLWPYDLYPSMDYRFLKDTGVTVTVRVRGEEVACRVRLADQYGNAPLYLLDTNSPGGRHGWMTSRLYSGMPQDRVAAEIILGIGGVRMLRALGLAPSVWHANEGHSAFLMLELLREFVQNGLSHAEASEIVRQRTVFTTHTPVPAGHDVFPHELMDRYFSGYWEQLGLSREEFLRLGDAPDSKGRGFNMTALAMRLSAHVNGVSREHGRVTREMWHHLWPGLP